MLFLAIAYYATSLRTCLTETALVCFKVIALYSAAEIGKKQTKESVIICILESDMEENSKNLF